MSPDFRPIFDFHCFGKMRPGGIITANVPWSKMQRNRVCCRSNKKIKKNDRNSYFSPRGINWAFSLLPQNPSSDNVCYVNQSIGGNLRERVRVVFALWDKSTLPVPGHTNNFQPVLLLFFTRCLNLVQNFLPFCLGIRPRENPSKPPSNTPKKGQKGPLRRLFGIFEGKVTRRKDLLKPLFYPFVIPSERMVFTLLSSRARPKAESRDLYPALLFLSGT